MRDPLKSIARWWLARKLPTDLKAGDICMVRSGEGNRKGVAKVLAVDKNAIHVRLYRESFAEVPRSVNMGILTWGIGHLPIARATFASWQPVVIQHDPVTEDELDGYRMWKEDGGGVF